MRLLFNYNKILFLVVVVVFLIFMGCKDDDMFMFIIELELSINIGDIIIFDDGLVDFFNFFDMYVGVVMFVMIDQWRYYNVYDFFYVVDDEFMYCYNIDVVFGYEIRVGI